MSRRAKQGQWAVLCATSDKGRGVEVGRALNEAKACGLCVEQFYSRATKAVAPFYVRLWVVGPKGVRGQIIPTGMMMSVSIVSSETSYS